MYVLTTAAAAALGVDGPSGTTTFFLGDFFLGLFLGDFFLGDFFLGLHTLADTNSTSESEAESRHDSAEACTSSHDEETSEDVSTCKSSSSLDSFIEDADALAGRVTEAAHVECESGSESD
jgi:hypothetical protein